MNPINNVLQHFPDARKNGSGWSTRCPAHEDRNPSLSISEGRDGRVLLHCHAGCDVSDICRKKGLSLSDLMAPSLARNPFKGPATRRRGHGSAEEAIRYAERRLGSRAREWRYFDATDGMHIGSIVRWDRPDGGKDIRPFSLKNGEWRAEGMDSPRPLYNRGATVGAEMAVVTEGEKAADAATALGYIAVTSAHGANSAQNTDWSPLAGKVVVLLPDNDEVGEQYAREVCRLLRDVSPAPTVKVARLPRLPEGGDIADLLEASADHDALRAEIDRFLDEAPPADQPPEEEPNPPDDDRPKIVIRPDEKPRITDESLELLAEDHFQRDREIVRCQPTPSGMRIVSVTPESLDDILNRRAQFATLRVDRRRGGEPEEVAACAPAWLSNNICAIQAWRHIRHLEGIYNTPVLQADKTVAGLSAGYDAATRCWFDTTEDWSELSVPPTEQDVETAVATLLDVIAEFPFCSDVDRSVWIAAILTRIARPAFEGPSPLFIFNATTPGSGKTLLANLIGLITEGYTPGMKTLPSSDEETRKLLTSSLLAGEGILVFDNVAGEVSSPVLDRFLTSDVWSDRLLGSSKTVTIKNQSLAIATGNNATIVGDTTRRCFQSMLAPTEEHPENRVFRIENLPAFVRKNRRSLLIAAIRILQWHVVRGCPQQKTHVIRDADGNDVVAVVKPLGSFEGWSAMVRQAVMGAGLPDPTLSSFGIAETDEARASKRCFLEAWAAWNPDFHASARQMIDAAIEQDGTASRRLIEAICELVGEGGVEQGKPKPTALGNAIRQFQGRNFANLRAEWNGRSNSGSRWKLVRMEPPRP